MTIDFICQQCDGSFELDFSDLLEEDALVCPNCGQSSSDKSAEEFSTALDELFARLAKLRSRFVVSLAIESDELPPPYDEDSDEDDEEEDDDYEDDEDEDDEDDEDDDEDDDDEDDDEDDEDEDDEY